MARIKIAAFIVLYNKNILTTEAYQTLKDQTCDLFIFDNSTLNDIAKANKSFAKKQELQYYSSKKNIGLAKAYNFLIDKCKGYDFILTSDDDTLYPANYIDFFLANNKGYSIFFPKIFDLAKNETWKVKPYRNKYIMLLSNFKLAKESGYYYFINSGTFYSCKELQKLKFHNNLFIELIDVEMAIRLKKLGIKQKQLDITIQQNFSSAAEKFLPGGRTYLAYQDYFTIFGAYAFIHLLALFSWFSIIDKEPKYFTLFFYICKRKIFGKT